MTRLLERAPDIDAVFAASDVMAVGAIDALRRSRQTGARGRRRRRVRRFRSRRRAHPPLTTVRQPWPDISATMIDMLLDIIDGTPRESVVLPTTLVVRESA